MIKDLKRIVQIFSEKIYYDMGNYSQFTIDVFEEFEDDCNRDDLHEEAGKLGCIQDLIGAIIYKVQNILDVIKEGKDRDVFDEFLTDLKKINL